MNRTAALLATAGLLATFSLVVGKPPPPPVKDDSHTVVKPGEAPADKVLPLTTAPGEGALTFEGKLSGAYVLRGPSEAFAHLEVRARPSATPGRVPVNLALVVDRSGSMRGRKLEDARRAAHALVERLTAEDRLAIVHYGSDVTVFPSTPATDEARARMRGFIDAIQDAGATNISGGLNAAADELRPHRWQFKVSRVLLLSDGQPTMGVVDERELLARAGALRAAGMTVSGLGVGADFNEQLMQGFAEQGGGFYGFLADSRHLSEVLTRELEQAAGTVARDVALTLELPPSVKDVEVLGLPATREGNTVRIPLYDLAGGQSARVVVRLTLETGEASAPVELLAATLSYVDVTRDGAAQARLALAARVTEDAALVRENLDRDVRVNATRALGAQQLRAASEEMKRGNRDVALGLLDNARLIFGSSGQALSGELADVDQTRAAYSQEQDEAAVRRQAMDLRRKTMRGFGQDNSYEY
ncbi:VWA domain-containing protein [Myxococcaceae bacterium GXIMD 01537]